VKWVYAELCEKDGVTVISVSAVSGGRCWRRRMAAAAVHAASRRNDLDVQC